MRKNKKIVMTGLFIALGTTLSFLSFPVGVSRCYPVQHLLNLLSAVLLGPSYALAQAFCTSLLRNILSLGTILAFPGSLFGAALSSFAYQKAKKLSAAMVGEVLGTTFLGGLGAAVIARLFLPGEVLLYGFFLPFFVSTLGGSLIGAFFLLLLKRLGVLEMD